MIQFAIKNYSVLKVFRNAISFPHCRIMEILWNIIIVFNAAIFAFVTKLSPAQLNTNLKVKRIYL